MAMPRGDSGRIVLEIDPSHKDQLYSALTKDGMTLKDWFLKQASLYLQHRLQPSLFPAASVAETPAAYGKTAVSPSKKAGSRKKSSRK
jgi:hypothetical protein